MRVETKSETPALKWFRYVRVRYLHIRLAAYWQSPNLAPSLEAASLKEREILYIKRSFSRSIKGIFLQWFTETLQKVICSEFVAN